LTDCFGKILLYIPNRPAYEQQDCPSQRGIPSTTR
jgi:hypothetical protein